MFRTKTRKSSRSLRIHERRRRARIKKILLVSMSVVVLFLIPFAVSRIPYMRVDTVTVSGTEFLDSGELTEFVERMLEGKKWHLYPRNNIGLIRTSKIETSLRETYPRIAEVDVSRSGLTELSVTIRERGAFALWCKESSSCLFIDDQGLGFAEVPSFSATVFLIFERDGKDLEIGTRVSSVEDFLALRSFINAIEDYGLFTERIAITDTDATLTLEGGGLIYLALETLPQAFTNLVAVLDDAEVSIRDESGLTVEYVDLRFDNKVFYKSPPDEL